MGPTWFAKNIYVQHGQPGPSMQAPGVIRPYEIGVPNFIVILGPFFRENRDPGRLCKRQQLNGHQCSFRAYNATIIH